MPTPNLTPDQEDTLFEAISKQLFRVNQIIKGVFGREMEDQELERAYQRVKQGIDQAMQAPPKPPQPTPSRPVNPTDMVEGGFVNDSSGAATALLRKQQGIQ